MKQLKKDTRNRCKEKAFIAFWGRDWEAILHLGSRSAGKYARDRLSRTFNRVTATQMTVEQELSIEHETT